MSVIIINNNSEAVSNRIINYLKKLGASFKVVENLPNDEDEVIKSRLQAKYGSNGEWDKMSLEEKEDATLLELMLQDESGDREIIDWDIFKKELQGL